MASPDRFLRGWGFRIHSRPAAGEPLWERRGRVMTQTQAVFVARYEHDRAIKQLRAEGRAK